MSQTRQVVVCAIPYNMTLVEGGVLFSVSHGLSGVSSRFMFEYTADGLWYLTSIDETFGRTLAIHLVRMHQLLGELVAKDFEFIRTGRSPWQPVWRSREEASR